jgi:small-conductance mechanosensitive channel
MLSVARVIEAPCGFRKRSGGIGSLTQGDDPIISGAAAPRKTNTGLGTSNMNLDFSSDFLQQSLFGSTLLQWGLAAATLLIIFVVLSLVRRIAGRRLRVFSGKTETKWDDLLAKVINGTGGLTLLVVASFLASLFLQPPEPVRAAIKSIFVIVLLVQGGIWLGIVTRSLLEDYRHRLMTTDPAAATTVNAMGLLARIVIWSVVVLLALDNLGIDVTALVAGLGIGGVAVALAVQNVLGDLFASLSIILDKPFVIGDFLVIDDFLGSVEHVGLKTTRVRSLSGEQLIFSNSDLLNSRIRNYGRMFERRVVFNIGVTYDTPREKLERIPGMIRRAIEAQEKTRFDRSHFNKYGDYALQFETVFYVLTADYNRYMDIQQAVNFSIHQAFEEQQIEFAYPSQTLFVRQLAAQ